jgi:hypothetical protein
MQKSVRLAVFEVFSGASEQTLRLQKPKVITIEEGP